MTDELVDIEALNMAQKSNLTNSNEVFEIQVDKKNFSKSLSHVHSVVERRNIIPIMANVLLEAKDSHVSLTTTDMDIIASEKIAAQVIEEGSITVNAAMLYDIVKKLDEHKPISIKLNQDNSTINILSAGCDFTLSTLPAKDFPNIDIDSYDNKFSMNAVDFNKLLDQCKFAISNDEIRYSINGIYLHCEDSCLKMVATDIYRLSIATSKKIESLSDFPGVIIPKKTVHEIRKITDELSEEISISVSENKINFSNENFSLTSKLVDAQFPNYQELIPKENNIVLTIDKNLLSSAIDRVSTVNNEKFRGVRLELEDNSLTLSSSSELGGYAKETIQVLSNTPDTSFEVGFNARYMLEVLNVLEGEEISFTFKDSMSPAVFKELDNKNFQYIIMSMRV